MEDRKVLFVEDDRVTLATIGHMVKDEPYQSMFAENGHQAIEILENEDIDVVVTDLEMPEINGIELLDWVKANKTDAVRVVASAKKDSGTLLSAINRGSIYRYVTKPIDREDLKITVRQSLEISIIQKDRQRLLLELERANLKLQETVQYRTNQVLDLYNQAEIGKYSAQLVHNLNNPLQAIFGALHISQIALETSPPDEDSLKKMHRVLLSGADKLEKIIDSVLSHSKNPALYKPERVNINALVEDEMEFFNLNATFKNEVNKEVDLQKDLLPVFGNYIQLKQILDNLIKNAIDAMQETSDKRLKITTHNEEGWIFISVSDTGEGIEAKNFEKIFQPDFSTKPRDKGTGLGLASVRSMVAAYNGEVQVRSERGEGTTFTVRLPAYNPEADGTKDI